MTLEIKKKPKETTIKVVGCLDSFTAPVLERTINTNAQGASCIVLDLSGVEHISDAGHRVLLTAQERLSSKGSFRLVGVGESIREGLRTAGIANA